MLTKLRSPVALVTEGFLAGALLFLAANPGFLHHRSAGDDRAAALVQELIR
ncbi:MAG: hypothetical protein JO013_03010 [Alphaproteobacteria bacterium]|nr:hypothetical protein [Alphaproteobacteria bacterium]